MVVGSGHNDGCGGCCSNDGVGCVRGACGNCDCPTNCLIVVVAAVVVVVFCGC